MLKRLLYQLLAFIVQRTGRLVKNQDAWIAQESASDGDALALSY
nr:hypothetical protein [Ktedonobacter racemifer]